VSKSSFVVRGLGRQIVERIDQVPANLEDKASSLKPIAVMTVAWSSRGFYTLE
jgi:hypothetical protein